MKREALSDAARILFIGSVASVLSTAIVSLGSANRTGSATAGTNATSQWVHGERARRERSPSWRYTLLGYLIHHGSSVFWAGLYDSRAAAAIMPRPGPRAAATAAFAAAVDYGIVPRRFNPGFDSHLSLPAMAATYAMFGLGLWLGTRSHRPRVNRVSPAVRGHARRDR